MYHELYISSCAAIVGLFSLIVAVIVVLNSLNVTLGTKPNVFGLKFSQYVCTLLRHTHTHTHTPHPAPKLQALVYNILPSTSAVFSYATVSRKLSANEQFLLSFGAQIVSKFVTNNLKYIRHFFFYNYVAYTSSNKTKIVLNRDIIFLIFYPGWIVYACAWVQVLGLLPQSYQYPHLSEGADYIGGQLCGDKELRLSGINHVESAPQRRNQIGRVWRKVQESDA